MEQIKTYLSNKVIFEGEYDSTKDCIEEAIKHTTNFADANLNDLFLKYLRLKKGNYIKDELDFRNCKCENTILRKSFLENINFKFSKFKNVDFRYSTLKNIDFRNCYFDDVDLRNCTFKNVDFRNCTFKNVDLRNCTFKNVFLSKINLDSSSMISITDNE